jgi:hypothetical protein
LQTPAGTDDTTPDSALVIHSSGEAPGRILGTHVSQLAPALRWLKSQIIRSQLPLPTLLCFAPEQWGLDTWGAAEDALIARNRVDEHPLHASTAPIRVVSRFALRDTQSSDTPYKQRKLKDDRAFVLAPLPTHYKCVDYEFFTSQCVMQEVLWCRPPTSKLSLVLRAFRAKRLAGYIVLPHRPEKPWFNPLVSNARWSRLMYVGKSLDHHTSYCVVYLSF